jgi:hypothetical protein
VERGNIHDDIDIDSSEPFRPMTTKELGERFLVYKKDPLEAARLAFRDVVRFAPHTDFPVKGKEELGMLYAFSEPYLQGLWGEKKARKLIKRLNKLASLLGLNSYEDLWREEWDDDD